ncbi:hypothetical protein D3C80_1317610 [compost metagenome]
MLDHRRLFGSYRSLLDLTRFNCRCFDRSLEGYQRFSGWGFFGYWLWRNFDNRLGSSLDHRFAGWQLDDRCYGSFLDLRNSFDLFSWLGDFAVVGFDDFGGGALGLLVGLGLGFRADAAAGDSCSHGQAGCQISAQLGGLVLLWLLIAAVFLAAFDQFTVGIALTLATIAATTLAAGAATWTFAIGTFLLILQQLFVRQLLIAQLCCLLGGLFGSYRLAFFAWWAWLALFAWGTLFAR